MKVGGAYNANSTGQRRGAESTLPYVRDAAKLVAQLPVTTNTLTLVDYGSSQARNSFPVVNTFITQYREHGDNRQTPVTVIHEDQPQNDWIEVFNVTQNDKESYLQQQPNVYTLASGLGFYYQVVAANTVHFGTSTTAMHWLSKTPVKLSNHYHTLFSTGDERKQWKQQAADDWSTILQHRANEIVDNGVFLTTLAYKDTDESKNGIEGTADGIYKVMVILQQRGVLTQDDLLNINQASWYRTRKEIQDGIAANGQFKTLTIEPLRSAESPFAELRRTDTKLFAKKVTGAMDAVLHPGFARAVSGSAAEKQSKADAIFTELEQYVEQHPDEFAHSSYYAVVVLQRKPRS